MPVILTVLGFLWWWPMGLLLLGLFIGEEGSAVGVTCLTQETRRCSTGNTAGIAGNAR